MRNGLSLESSDREVLICLRNLLLPSSGLGGGCNKLLQNIGNYLPNFDALCYKPEGRGVESR
jgi:hypothetical protein